MVLLWPRIHKFNCCSELQPCTSTYCIRRCFKDSSGKKTLQPQRGSYLIPNCSSSPPDEKSDARLPMGALFLSRGGNLWGYFYSIPWTYLRGRFAPAKASSKAQCLLWGQNVGRCVESFMPVRSDPSVTDGASSFLPPKLTVWLLQWLIGLLGQNRHPGLRLVPLTMGPGCKVPSNFGPRQWKEQRGEKKVVVIFP